MGLALACLLAFTPARADQSCQTVADASRISVAGGSVTEILYALGEQSRIIGVDTTSNYPAAALDLPQLGYVRNLSTEGVLSLSPTLVLGEHDMGPPDVLAQLQRVGIPIVAVPEQFDYEGIVNKVRCVGQVIGTPEAAETLIQEIPPPPPANERPSAEARGLVILTLVEGAPVAAGQDTSGEGFLRLAGASNALSFEGWKPVSAESMAAAEPDFIVITERGLKAAGSVEQLLAHPALITTPAARNRRVLSMDGMAMLGFGLRTARSAAELRAYLAD